MSMTIGGKQVASITIGGKTVSTIGIGGKIVEIASAVPNYFYVQAEAAGAQVWLDNVSNTPSLEYSTDGTTWTSWDYSPITLANIGDKVYFRGNNPSGFSTSQSNVSKIKCTADYSVGGDIAYLVSTSGYVATFPDYCFIGMFNSQAHLLDASDLILSATTIGYACYYNMFYSCTALTSAPVISATVVDDYACKTMFSGCTSLTSVQSTLPATTLGNYCYQDMFKSCSSLETAPVLPATTLADACYKGMFRYCSLLNNVTIYATDVSIIDCTTSWLFGVSSNGDFYNLGGATFESGINGIPTGWTEHTSL